MTEKIEKKRLAILKILKKTNEPVPSQKIQEELENSGYNISERTVRFHLLAMDKVGYTQYVGKRGRRITDKGLLELSKAKVYDKIGFLSAKIDEMAYKMNFDLYKKTGKVVINLSLLEKNQIKKAYPLMTKVFETGYAMGNLLAFFDSGEQVEDIEIPKGFIGVGTVCSITLNGVLLNNGIPVRSRFGGVLETEDFKPLRFVAIINYDGTSLDPLEIFIKSGMTDYIGATESGTGLIGASFREIPASSRDKVVDIAEKLKEIGLGGFMTIGYPGQSIYEIPLSEGLCGAVVIGGLNPIAILEETGHNIFSKALSGFVDYNRLFHYSELKSQIEKYC
jgi:HTH-type transcriptional regulator, global nitrogen regulator NrpRI